MRENFTRYFFFFLECGRNVRRTTASVLKLEEIVAREKFEVERCVMVNDQIRFETVKHLEELTRYMVSLYYSFPFLVDNWLQTFCTHSKSLNIIVKVKSNDVWFFIVDRHGPCRSDDHFGPSTEKGFCLIRLIPHPI